ncbi:hypothetical protein ANCCAN_17484 [Ancylostoma caninum]|uniref:Uncharacterized protein n=1 Tax=Ancylostoma caninum TaxID=29170 RepID=A0A368FWS2_ANCCA|nr:hypothetical protein ANCCAN_17484 [Ancylostoma caninum]
MHVVRNGSIIGRRSVNARKTSATRSPTSDHRSIHDKIVMISCNSRNKKHRIRLFTRDR